MAVRGFMNRGDTGRGDGSEHWDLISPEGALRMTMTPGEPCTCACTSVFFDGAIYGPGTWREVHETTMRLHKDADFELGLTDLVVENHSDARRRALTELDVHHGPAGHQLRDPA